MKKTRLQKRLKMFEKMQKSKKFVLFVDRKMQPMISYIEQYNVEDKEFGDMIETFLGNGYEVYKREIKVFKKSRKSILERWALAFILHDLKDKRYEEDIINLSKALSYWISNKEGATGSEMLTAFLHCLHDTTGTCNFKQVTMKTVKDMSNN